MRFLQARPHLTAHLDANEIYPRDSLWKSGKWSRLAIHKAETSISGMECGGNPADEKASGCLETIEGRFAERTIAQYVFLRKTLGERPARPAGAG
jgi:hypothetical protein